MTALEALSRQVEAGQYFEGLKIFFQIGLETFEFGARLVEQVHGKSLPEDYTERLEESRIVVQSTLLGRSRDTFKAILLAVSGGCCSDAQALFRLLFEQYLDMKLLQVKPVEYTEAFLFYDYIRLEKALNEKRRWCKQHSSRDGLLSPLEKDEKDVRRKSDETKKMRKKKLGTRNHSNWSGLNAVDRLAEITEPNNEAALFSEFFFAWRVGSQFVHPSGLAAGKYFCGGVDEPISMTEYHDKDHLRTILMSAVRRHLSQMAVLNDAIGSPMREQLDALSGKLASAHEAEESQNV